MTSIGDVFELFKVYIGAILVAFWSRNGFLLRVFDFLIIVGPEVAFDKEEKNGLLLTVPLCLRDSNSLIWFDSMMYVIV